MITNRFTRCRSCVMFNPSLPALQGVHPFSNRAIKATAIGEGSKSSPHLSDDHVSSRPVVTGTSCFLYEALFPRRYKGLLSMVPYLTSRTE